MSSVLAAGVLVVGLGSPAAAAEQTPDSPLPVAASEPRAGDHAAEQQASSTPDPRQARKAARQRIAGISLLAGAGVLNTAALALNVLHAKGFVDSCRTECDYDIFSFALPAAGLNLIAVGLAPGGGALLRRYDEWKAGAMGVPRLTARNIAITGAVLLGAGLLGEALSWSIALEGIPTPPCDDIQSELQCKRTAVTGDVIGFQLSAHLASAGAGMLAYGVTPRPTRRERRRHSFHVAPMLGRRVGLSVAAAF